MKFIGTHSLLAGLCASATAESRNDNGEEAFTFTTWSKQQAEGYKGTFEVPENRSKKKSRKIPIKYMRFAGPARSSKPGRSYMNSIW